MQIYSHSQANTPTRNNRIKLQNIEINILKELVTYKRTESLVIDFFNNNDNRSQNRVTLYVILKIQFMNEGVIWIFSEIQN